MLLTLILTLREEKEGIVDSTPGVKTCKKKKSKRGWGSPSSGKGRGGKTTAPLRLMKVSAFTFTFIHTTTQRGNSHSMLSSAAPYRNYVVRSTIPNTTHHHIWKKKEWSTRTSTSLRACQTQGVKREKKGPTSESCKVSCTNYFHYN